ncbi:MAG: hypothetical protein IMZ66_10370 [Planctomycetes bacterium]|nr:hypothetical protein [Planctomycetota bacterium]
MRLELLADGRLPLFIEGRRVGQATEDGLLAGGEGAEEERAPADFALDLGGGPVARLALRPGQDAPALECGRDTVAQVVAGGGAGRPDLLLEGRKFGGGRIDLPPEDLDPLLLLGGEFLEGGIGDGGGLVAEGLEAGLGVGRLAAKLRDGPLERGEQAGGVARGLPAGDPVADLPPAGVGPAHAEVDEPRRHGRAREHDHRQTHERFHSPPSVRAPPG